VLKLILHEKFNISLNNDISELSKNGICKHTVKYHFVVNFVEMNLADFVDDFLALIGNKSKPYAHKHKPHRYY